MGKKKETVNKACQETIQKIQEPEKVTKGVVIMALKHNVYARYAHNLITSIRQPDNGLFKNGIKVCLIADEPRLEEMGVKGTVMFDKIITLSAEEAHNPFFVKTQLYNLSSYDETLYLDADTLLMPSGNIPSIFNELSGVQFTIANRGYMTRESGGYDWADIKNLFDAVGTEQFPHVSSEFIYFKKTDKVKELFEKAVNFYLSNTIINKTIGGFQPDEPAFGYAMEQVKIKPHKIPFHPTFWEGHYKNIAFKPQQIYAHPLLSIGGSEVSKRSSDIYDGLLKGYGKKANTTCYNYQPKGKIIKERATL